MSRRRETDVKSSLLPSKFSRRLGIMAAKAPAKFLDTGISISRIR